MLEIKFGLRDFQRPGMIHCLLAIGILLAVPGGAAFAQDTEKEDDTINAIRRQQGQIGESDQRRINDWVQARAEALSKTPAADRQAAAVKFRARFRDQMENAANSAAFKQQFPVQTAGVAAAQFGNPNLDPIVGRALARVLLDMPVPETTPALLAGIQTKDAATRYLCAEGIAAQRTAIAADKDQLERMVKAVRDAAVAETDPAVLGRYYAALSVPPNQAGAVFEAISAIFEKRLQFRRGFSLLADGAEIDAYEYFRTPAVLNALNPQQKETLVRALAVFLRMDAQRYQSDGLSFEEMDRIERMLDGTEEILATILGPGKGGTIRDVLSQSGHERRADVLAQAYQWVGQSEGGAQGVLNGAPWNVPAGAP